MTVDPAWMNFFAGLDWKVLAILIFFARIVDVSIGTMRIIYVARGMKVLAALCGFFEVMLWLLAITQVMQNLTHFPLIIAYAAGFATGNYVGIVIESKLAVGMAAVRAVTEDDAAELVGRLAEQDFKVTSMAARGVSGKVRLVIAVVRRRDVDAVIQIINQFQPDAFITIEDVKPVSESPLLPAPRRDLGSIRTVRKWK